MRKSMMAGAAGLCMLLGACTAGTSTTAPTVTAPTPASVCQAIANVQANPTASAQLAAQTQQNTALGSVWAYAQSGCNGATPAAGVDASWTQEVWAMVQALAPVVLPALIGLI